MNKNYALFLILVGAMIFMTVDSIADVFNPKPYDGDLILPMPNAGGMVFRPVFIGVGDDLFASKDFKVGDSSSGFKEYPTAVIVGGSFRSKNKNNQKDWLYYIGKYEVTESQYYSIMDSSKASDSQFPINNISWFDVQNFINKYNLWLFENSKDKLPKNEESIGFLRLPSEIEWEFAARGGGEIDKTQIDKRHPYPDTLSKYEWFSGPSSSHGKVQKTGVLEPNVLKIHDMLGNVSEMTSSLYQIEYYQGRIGGFVYRGGNFTTAENMIRSSLRGEIPFYGRDLRPAKQDTLGIRLVIGSQIIDSIKTSKDLEVAWPVYLAKRQPPTPPPDIRDPSDPNRRQKSDANEILVWLETQLKNIPNIIPGISEKLGLLKASLSDISSINTKGKYDSAYAWIKVSSETSFMLVWREMKRKTEKLSVQKIASEAGKSATVENIERQIKEIESNIQEGIESYGSAFIELEKIQESIVKESFEKYRNELTRKGKSGVLKCSELVQRHYDQYLQDKRMDAERWKVDIERLTM